MSDWQQLQITHSIPFPFGSFTPTWGASILFTGYPLCSCFLAVVVKTCCYIHLDSHLFRENLKCFNLCHSPEIATSCRSYKKWIVSLNKTRECQDRFGESWTWNCYLSQSRKSLNGLESIWKKVKTITISSKRNSLNLTSST